VEAVSPVIRRGCTNVICDGDEGGPAVRFSPSMAGSDTFGHIRADGVRLGR
jgi:hypothetical protein